MAVVQLPAENLEHIFQFLDGKSFAKSREVCKVWYGIIKEMQQKSKIWKKFCIQEIPDYILEEILFFKTAPHTDPYLKWSDVYKKWYRTRMIVEAPHSLKTIPPPHVKYYASITCLKLSGNWIITGHSSGHLCIWNQESGELFQRNLCHLKCIVDIAMVDLLNLGFYYGTEDLPWEHHHAITISRDSYIQVISLLETSTATRINHLNYHSTDLTAIRVFNSNFAVCSSDNIVSLWSMSLQRKPYFHLNTVLLQRIIGPPDNLLNLGLWRNQIQCISFGGKLKVFDVDKDSWTEAACLKEIYQGGSDDQLITVTKSFLFRTNTVIMFTSDGRMVVSVDGKVNNQYYLMKTLQTLIISIALRGTLFALGGENGKVYVFHVPQTECLLTLNLSHPSFIMRLSEGSITSLDIAFDAGSPMVIASTNESIFVLKWFTSLSSRQEIKKRTLIEYKKSINEYQSCSAKQ